MKLKVILRFGIAGVSLLLLGALTAETVNQLYVEPRTVSSWSELVDCYLVSRTSLPPLPLAYDDVFTKMKAGDWSFLADHWRYKQVDGSYYVAKDSNLAELKLPLRILVYEDIQRSEIVVLSSTDGTNFQGEALFKAPEFMPYEKDVSLDRYASDELWPRRIIWEITLKPEADAWSDLVSRESSLVASTLSLDDGEMMMTMSVPAEHADDIWLAFETQTSGINLNIFAPEGFTNRVEVYSCTDLISNVWNIVVQDLYPSTNPAVWDADSEWITRFFRAGNMDIDGDEDGLPDAREQIVHKTNPENPDSDNDALTDGEEVGTYGLNPLSGDSNNDGVPDAIDAHMQGTAGENGLLVLMPSGQYRHMTESTLPLNAYGAYPAE